jgi:hypothetical protein
MIHRKPEDHLFSVMYKFSHRELSSIFDEYILKTTGLPNIQYSLSYDDEDNQARLLFDMDDTEEDIWAILEEKMQYLEEDYYLPGHILKQYMRTEIFEVRGYSNWGTGETTFYVEASSKNYVEHISIHQWGF